MIVIWTTSCSPRRKYFFGGGLLSPVPLQMSKGVYESTLLSRNRSEKTDDLSPGNGAFARILWVDGMATHSDV